MADLRQPIVSLLGHVDHGKTTLLDRISGSIRAQREAGGITQHIGAIEVPKESVLALCEGILDTQRFSVPGLLFIDTPGHRSFETMRRRGGALADLAILVVDVREGAMPQTRESVQILRHEKTPFAVALTKIDLIAGWKKPAGPISLAQQLKRCGPEFERALDARLYAFAEEMDRMGFSVERYDRVSDFTRNIGIAPVSARSGVGIAELIALLVGLSQRFLQAELELVDQAGEGTILERSDQRGIGPVGSVIVYRGAVSVGDELVVTGRSAPFSTKIRGIYRPAPVVRGRGGKRTVLDSVPRVEAAAGVYLAAPGIEDALPGGLLKVVRTDAERTSAEADLAQESHPVADLAESGVALAADTLGGLEALAFECRQASIPIHEAGVGPVGRPTVLKVGAVKDPTHRAVLAFNVPVLPDALPEGSESPVRVFRGDVMYRVLEEYVAWREEKSTALKAQRRLQLVHPAKFEVLRGFVFRSSHPAIVGIKVLAGTLRPGVRVMRPDGVGVGLLKALQKDQVSVTEAGESDELAASIEGAVVGRNVREGDQLYVELPEGAARLLKSAPLTDREKAVLDEVVRLRRQENPFWGQ
ncbi:MAG: translation initiation factor IF-2 [Thermoplasmata archaeon]|nr:translation initiation factor IF-2 [Thermoplasmata archaeon]MCI4359405.1 translation initiation factor IF-2 [Thermoplasmata archaeon]